ncbi:MAG: ABC transporter permease, partial [Clostridiales Family XIII bacterium]|nr:ABC transporter permease [Clostridiales Family XIII bacterium]
IYFLTLTFGVCVFYIFNALESQEAMMKVSSSQAAIFKELSNIMGGVSVFISIILGFLILYANRFLIRRRKKEFGVYMTLGMEKGAISRILIAETAFVGLISLVTGLAAGVLLSQGMSVLTAKLMEAPIDKFRFIFSPEALVKTVVCFGIIFLFVLIFNTVAVGKQRLIDLLYAGRKNESVRATASTPLSALAFVAAIGCIFYAYTTLLGGKVGEFLDGSILPKVVAVGAVGTFLFFLSLSGIFMNLIPKSRKLYLKGLNMFVLRQIGSKINTTYISMTMVCLMLFISISTLSSGLGVSADIARELKKNAQFDVTISAHAKMDKNGEYIGEYGGLKLKPALKKQGIALDSFAQEYAAARQYDTGEVIPLKVKENNVEQVVDTLIYAMKLSDYNDILKMEGISPISLAKGEYAVNYAVTNVSFKKAMDEYMEKGRSITINGEKLKTGPANFYGYTLEVRRNQDYDVTIVVDDALVKGLPPVRDIFNINYLQGDGDYDKLARDAAAALSAGTGAESLAQTASDVRELSNSATVIVSYLAIYLGIVFLITAAAVLAIGQLSEVSDNIGRYSLLRKIGAETKMIHRSIFTQNLIYFGAPMLLAAIHATVGIAVVSRIVSAFDKGDIAKTSLLVAVAFLIIYGGYFLATYHGSKGILSRESVQRVE